jgi:hypothetical protein
MSETIPPKWYDPAMELPDKPSDLLELALRDLEFVEQDDKYRVRMWMWHLPERAFMQPASPPLYCNVCLAGSVLAKTLNVPFDVPVLVSEFDASGDEAFDKLVHKLRAVDYLREGDVGGALWILEYPREDVDNGRHLNRDVAEYDEDNPHWFYDSMRELVKVLRTNGY